MSSLTLHKRSATHLAVLVLAIAATVAAGDSVVGDPQIKTDHPYYQGELSYSTTSRLVNSALATTGRPATGETNKDKILKLWYWRIEHYYHQMSPQEYNIPGAVPNPPNNDPLMIDYDCLSQQFSFGHGVCGTNHAMFRPICEAAGFPSRRRGIVGDTAHEVYYNGRWALVNSDSASIISMSNSTSAEFAGVDDIIGNINLLLNNPLGIPQYPFGSLQDDGTHGQHASDWYSYYNGGFNLTVAESWRMYGEGYQARPIAYVLKRGEKFTRFPDRDGLPNYLGAAGAYRWWGFVGSGGPFRDWSYVGLAPALQSPPTSNALANSRFGNGIFEWTPTLAAGDAEDAVVAKDAAITYSSSSPHLKASSGTATITLAFFSPYCITGIPSDGADPAQSGATGGAWIVPTAVGSVPVEISTNNGASWASAGTLSGTTPLDFTDLVKGRHAYLMRFTVTTTAGLDAFTLKNCVEVATAVFPTLKAGGSQVTYNAGNSGVVEQNPDFSSLANANAFKVADSGNVSFTALSTSNSLAYTSTNNQPIWVTYRISAPPGKTLKRIDAAVDIKSRVPPAGGYARLAVSTDGGTNFTTFSDMTPDADNELSHFWGYGTTDISSAGVNEAIVKVISYNGGYTAGIRYVRLYGEYATPPPAALTITHTWDDSGGSGKTSTQNLAAGTTSTTYTVPTLNSPVSRSVAFSVAASPNTPVLTTITVTPSPVTVGAGKTQQFTATGLDQFGVALTPQPAFTWGATGGTVSASGLFTAGDAGGSATVTATSGSVSGSASVTVTAKPSLTVTPDNKSKTYGDLFTAFTGAITGILNGDNITATYASNGGAASAAAGSYDITATLNDPDGKAVNYTVVLNKGTLTVNKAAPVITWANPAEIVYGTALSATQLNAGANVAGTFSYTPAAGTVLHAGSQTLSVSFTPTDSANYAAATASVSITVKPAVAPAITSALTASATQGSAFSYQLTASGTAPLTLSAENLPPGLTFSGDTISGTPTVAGVAAVTLKATNIAGTETKTLQISIAKPAGAPNSAPSVSSPPTASSNTGATGQAVTFSADGSDSDGDLLSYTWDFGDGTTGTGASAAHTYTTPGLYSVTVTISDGTTTTPQQLDFVVSAGEAPVGDDNGGDNMWDYAGLDVFRITKASLKFNFASGTKDMLQLSGTIPVAKFFKPASKNVTVLIGGLRKDFTLNAKGQATAGASKFQMKGKMKKGVFKATPAKFALSVKGEPLLAALQEFGFADATTAKTGEQHTISAIIMVDTLGYENDHNVLYKATAAKGGAGKTAK